MSLGQLRYLSALKHVDFVLGNSSSGLTEVPSFKIPTINIGDRQFGRLKAKSVIDCNVQTKDIIKAINFALNPSNKRKINKYSYCTCTVRRTVRPCTVLSRV